MERRGTREMIPMKTTKRQQPLRRVVDLVAPSALRPCRGAGPSTGSYGAPLPPADLGEGAEEQKIGPIIWPDGEQKIGPGIWPDG